jgi:hypothetical protein
MGDGAVRSPVTGAPVNSSREIIEGSRRMVAWSIGRLLATNPALRSQAAAPTEILLKLLGSPCDFDVLLFAHRHPRALLHIDDIARAVGHGVGDVRASIDALTATNLIVCRKARAADAEASALFYEFTPGAWDAILPALAWVTASEPGRHALRRALSRRHRH